MRRVSTVAGGAAAALSGQLVVYAFGFVTSIIVARAVGASGRGEYLLPVTAATAVLALAGMGLESSGAVAVAERKVTLERYSGLSSALALLVGPPAAAVVMLVWLVTRHGAFAGVAAADAAIVAVSVPLSLHQLWRASVFLLAHRLALTQAALVCGAAVQLVGAVVLSATGALHVFGVLALYTASVAVPWLLMCAWARDVAPVRPRLSRQAIRAVVPFGLKLLPGLALVQLLLRFDVFLVAAYLTAADVGRYTLAVLFAELGWLITTPLAQAAVPFQADVGLEASAALAFKAARFNAFLATVLAAGFAATLWWILPTFYGEEFSAAYGATVALLPGVVATAASRPLTLLVTRRIRPARYSLLAASCFGLNCVLNIVLIPRIGIVGSSLASTAAYTLMAGGIVKWALATGGLRPARALLPQPGDTATVRRVLRRQA